jgi:phosphoserine phosphatase
LSLIQVFDRFELSDVIELGLVLKAEQVNEKSNDSDSWQVSGRGLSEPYALYFMSKRWSHEVLARLQHALDGPIFGLLTRANQLNQYVFKTGYCDRELSESDAALLAELELDFALLPSDLDLNQIQLIVSDMDSTFIQQEVIDEIGAEAGIKEQVAEITERAMQGELDFSQSLRERVRLLKGVPERKLDIIFKRLQLSEGIDDLVMACNRCKIKIALVSGGFSFFVEKFQNTYNLYSVMANQLEFVDGVLTGYVIGDVVDAKRKSVALKGFQSDLQLETSQIAAMGDGANDINLLDSAGLSIAFRAKEALKKYANCHLEYGDFSLIAALIGQPD